MDLEENSSSDGFGTIHLPDDMLLFLAKHYLKEQDCLSLAMSGASDTFASLYTANRKRLAIGRNSYFLTPTSWARFFKECISPLSIVTFDASHTYWLPPEVLLHSIVQMTNLEELFLHDTRISLNHLPKIFENCNKLVKLTFTLHQKTLKKDEMDKTSLKQLQNGLAKLTHLKISYFALDDGNPRSIESWLSLFRVLTWCRDCVDLVIKFVSSPEQSESGLNYYTKENEFLGTTSTEEKMLDKIEAELFPLLIWMKNLRSLAILNRYHPHNRPIIMGFPIITRLLALLLPEHKSLERLWVTESVDYLHYLTRNIDDGGPCRLHPLKSLSFSKMFLFQYELDLTGERFAHLEHVGEVPFHHFHHLHNLKHVQGFFGKYDDEREFNDFCRLHPKLEQLLVKEGPIDYEEHFADDWSLPLLKILVFDHSGFPCGFYIKLIERCPNIEELQLYNSFSLPQHDFLSFLLRLKYLKRLSIYGRQYSPNAFHLPRRFFEQCPKLESLHLSGDSLAELNFEYLSFFLPAASNLRDLSLSWRLSDDRGISSLLHLLEALLESSKNLKYFERLVLMVYSRNRYYAFDRNAQFEELIVKFAKGMKKLVCLGIFGFPFKRSSVRLIQQKLRKEVLPLRPTFWFRVGNELPVENDTSVPRIHYDEMVRPIDRYYVPPNNLDLK